MGRMVESLAGEYGCEIVGIVDIDDAPRLAEASTVPREWSSADVAVDFSFPDAVPKNLPALARLGRNVVVAPNFSIGVVLFEAIVARSAALFASRDDFGAWIHESHHVLKKDAPSGTALNLQRAMKQAGFERPIDMASTRAGHNPGSHSVGFDGPAESITLSHSARDRTAFARGALLAARWVVGKRGWFTMRDVLGL
jgi:4-hydroxy-tetrahydrodipicolinate reductase